MEKYDILKPPLVSYEENKRKKNKNINKEFYHILDNFERTLQNNSNFYSSFYTHNINNVKIHRINEDLDKKITIHGLYDGYKNEIFIKRKISTYHELFHLASSINYSNVLYSGFSQCYSSNHGIGDGLNEGYTNYLCHRYFKNCFSWKDIYIIETVSACILDRIIGPQMESLYFQANLHSLINILKNYSSEENILKFLTNLDNFNLLFNRYANNIFYKKYFYKCIKNIILFLSSISQEDTEINNELKKLELKNFGF